VAAYRRVSTAEAAEQQEREFMDCFWSQEGWLVLRGRLAADEGALFLRALEAARDVLWERHRAERAEQAAAAPSFTGESRVSNVEALAPLAELALARQDGDRGGGERYQVVVHVDSETLAADTEGRSELADGQSLAAETVRRLSCDASLVEVVEQDGRLLSLGRKRRTVSPALRRALNARDRSCRFPGCERTRFVDAHHVQHWSRGGETNLENLVLLCRRHHRLVHERGYTLSLDADGTTQFQNQYGIAIPDVPPRGPPSSPEALRDENRRLSLLIDADTCRNGTGDRMSLPLAVDALISIAG
jgi:5-methylcytosine-specific restriction endonuclease McrA